MGESLHSWLRRLDKLAERREKEEHKAQKEREALARKILRDQP